MLLKGIPCDLTIINNRIKGIEIRSNEGCKEYNQTKRLEWKIKMGQPESRYNKYW